MPDGARLLAISNGELVLFVIVQGDEVIGSVPLDQRNMDDSDRVMKSAFSEALAAVKRQETGPPGAYFGRLAN